ncbi:MAG: prolyl oligopeptidase family serine peptidase [Chloroflexota bacterium]|nr:prolyl oligopeptidase family serine peptidase [Chloroflexota bacterium]
MTAPAAVRVDPSALVRAQVAIDTHTIARDGSWVAYVRRTVVRGEYRRHLWGIGVDGGSPRRLTSGRVVDTCPAISPDGRRIAFLRVTADTRAPQRDRDPQAWVMPSGGGDAVPIGRLPHGVTGLLWSPDSRTLALLAPAAEARFTVGRVTEGVEPTARRLTRVDFRDDTGFLDHRVHLWLTSPRRGARSRQLTSGDFDVLSPAWSPDGATIAFVTDLGPDAGLTPQTVLCAIPVAGGELRRVAALRGDLLAPAWSPDGRFLAALGTDVADPPEATQPEVWLIDARTGEARSLSPGLDLPVGVWASTHLNKSDQPEGPIWLDDQSVVALVTRRGRCLPYRFGVDGTWAPLVDPESWIVADGIAAARGRVVVNAQVDGTPAELHAVQDGALRRLTRHGGAWPRRFPTPLLAERMAAGPAGQIQVWLSSPAGAGDEPLPTILDLHGGPTGSWGPGASVDVLALTAAGYRVARPNIRGSAGFGREWVEGLGARWGEADQADALTVADWLVAEELADPHRLGLLGLSYGGFLVNWLVGVTDRFATAVSENGVTNQATAWAECYFGVYDTRRTGLGDPLSEEGAAALWSRSPLRNVASIRTPLLMLQAAEDRVCPASDNFQLFAALRALDREVEYILYPEEHHVMQVIGRPDRRIDRLARVLAQFEAQFALGG